MAVIFGIWTCLGCRSVHPPRVLYCGCTVRDPDDDIDREARQAVEGTDAAEPHSPQP